MTGTTVFLPKHIMRLCAIGTLLQEGQMTYRALAESVRDFSAHLVGPSLDLMGSSMEVLRYEGLIATVGQTDLQSPSNAESLLHVTAHGTDEFVNLMTTPTELTVGDQTKLVITLKVRFLHLLPPETRSRQAEELADHYEGALTRLRTLNGLYEREPGHLSDWLAHDIAQMERRLDWFRALADSVAGDRSAAATDRDGS
ncbi:hypothetical protein [Fodinicurvata sp. EGI_FJ10296]|uniref:hypothetical protein n=1 Tax=Fodinicurvata sp. EGI_FJ10296 TaxID=3231908 RepID=UPI003452084A